MIFDDVHADDRDGDGGALVLFLLWLDARGLIAPGHPMPPRADPLDGAAWLDAVGGRLSSELLLPEGLELTAALYHRWKEWYPRLGIGLDAAGQDVAFAFLGRRLRALTRDPHAPFLPRLLLGRLGDIAREAGLQRYSRHPLAWQRAAAPRRGLAAWHTDHQRDFGGAFCVRVSAGRFDPEPDPTASGAADALSNWLTEDEREDLHARNLAVRGRLPRVLDWPIAGPRLVPPRRLPAPGADLWLRYQDIDDVHDWLDWLELTLRPVLSGARGAD